MDCRESLKSGLSIQRIPKMLRNQDSSCCVELGEGLRLVNTARDFLHARFPVRSMEVNNSTPRKGALVGSIMIYKETIDRGSTYLGPDTIRIVTTVSGVALDTIHT